MNRTIGFLYFSSSTLNAKKDKHLFTLFKANYNPSDPETLRQTFFLAPFITSHGFEAIKVNVDARNRYNTGHIDQARHILDIAIGPILEHPAFVCGFVDHKNEDLQAWREA